MISRIALLAVVATFLIPLHGFAEEQPKLQSIAEKLYSSLDETQRKQATLALDSPERSKEVFTGGERAGVQIRTLNADQQKLALSLLTAFTSEYGRQKALAITGQTINNPPDIPGFGRYYVCFFGEVGEGKTYAWRIAEHHLTLVYVEIDRGEPKSFGPILLGADPPVLWDDVEEKLMALYGAMTPDERARASRQGQGVSAVALDGRGVRVGDLNQSAKDAARAMVENRLAFFSNPVRQRARAIIDSQGGLDAMQIAFWGKADKRCRDGGKWDFKLAGPAFLCDYENTRGHIHLSMKGKLAETK